MNDGIQQLIDDHHKIFNVHKQFKDTSDTLLDSKKHSLQQLIQDMTIHDFIEHQVLYPMVREKLTTGNDMADRGVKQHKNFRRMMIELENIDFSQESIAEIDTKVENMIQTFREHVQQEENEVFPALRNSINEQDLDTMHNSLNRFRSVSPTHPREDVPEGTSVKGKISGAAAGIKDKVADTWESTGHQEKEKERKSDIY
eukprot:gb/GECH01008785.1/.p1 GENE.gb/GECH01008785.1/~~gb/GECH01008785.1/.p1  ORF type:complete len:200 (+),score=45.13 gb/GECH01008785.1/:1-600(+)